MLWAQRDASDLLMGVRAVRHDPRHRVVLTALTTHTLAPGTTSDDVWFTLPQATLPRIMGGFTVGGPIAHDLDTTAFILGHAPRAVGIVVGATVIALFLLLGSILLPLNGQGGTYRGACAECIGDDIANDGVKNGTCMPTSTRPKSEPWLR